MEREKGREEGEIEPKTHITSFRFKKIYIYIYQTVSKPDILSLVNLTPAPIEICKDGGEVRVNLVQTTYG